METSRQSSFRKLNRLNRDPPKRVVPECLPQPWEGTFMLSPVFWSLLRGKGYSDMLGILQNSDDPGRKKWLPSIDWITWCRTLHPNATESILQCMINVDPKTQVVALQIPATDSFVFNAADTEWAVIPLRLKTASSLLVTCLNVAIEILSPPWLVMKSHRKGFFSLRQDSFGRRANVISCELWKGGFTLISAQNHHVLMEDTLSPFWQKEHLSLKPVLLM